MKSFHQSASPILRHLVAVVITIVAIILVAALSGCAAIEFAGHAEYKATAVKDAAGKVTGYEFSAKDGKEFESREIQFNAMGDSVNLVITEGASKAFKGQGIAAKTLTVLPVNGLPDILK